MFRIFCFNKKQNKLLLSKELLQIKEELLHKKSDPKPSLSSDDLKFIETIHASTTELNVNNVTRTKAYLEFYRQHPEIHWAFLGHMVSRNGGWNMTDLKGDFISNLLEEKACQDFFSFLERGNWLIFQDAYPQFLIYKESLRRNKNLFYLLEHFNISSFMETMWNDFWCRKDKYLLTIALIINEQNYLEKRVMNNDYFKNHVFGTFEFKLQEILAFNHILFPYIQKGKIKFIGQTINQFDSLHERIMLGKRLYSILFSKDTLLKCTENWANANPHSGSRKDYWPHLFNDIKEYVPGNHYIRRLKKCQLRPGTARFYSPKLEFAWKNVLQNSAEVGDWFEDWKVIEYLIEDTNQVDGEILNEYCETLDNLELAVIAKKAIFLK